MEADEKECPFCAEIIKAKAKVCKHCKSELLSFHDGVTVPNTLNINPAPVMPTMMTRETIEAQIRALGEFDRFFTRKEINYLPEIMRPGETIRALTSGMLDGNTWLIVVTDQRVIFLDKGMLYGLKQLEIPLRNITGIVQSRGLMFGGITITAASVTHGITMIQKSDVKKVCDVISGLIHGM